MTPKQIERHRDEGPPKGWVKIDALRWTRLSDGACVERVAPRQWICLVYELAGGGYLRRCGAAGIERRGYPKAFDAMDALDEHQPAVLGLMSSRPPTYHPARIVTPPVEEQASDD